MVSTQHGLYKQADAPYVSVPFSLDFGFDHENKETKWKQRQNPGQSVRGQLVLLTPRGNGSQPLRIPYRAC